MAQGKVRGVSRIIASGGITVAPTHGQGDVTIGGGGATQACKVYQTSGQSIGDAAWATMNFDAEVFDNDTMHDNVTNNSRITIKTAGKYLIVAFSVWAANATGVRGVRIFRNGAQAAGKVNLLIPTTSVFNPGHDSLTIFDAVVNDYFEMQVFQNSGAALAQISQNNESGAHFAAHRLS